MKRFKGLNNLYVLVIAALLQGACTLPGAAERNGSEGAEGLPFPANFNAMAMSPSSVYLVWDQVDGITTYAVFISNQRNSGYNLLGETEDRSFIDNSLNPSTTYYYKVAAVSADGTGPLSDPAQARTLEEGAAALLPPPGGVIASALSPVSVQISWNAVSGAEYNLYRAASFSGEKTKLNNSPLTATSYTDTGLTQSTSYYYFLRSLNADNAEGPWSPVTQATTQSNIDTTMPVPANLNASASGFTAIQLTWNTVSEAVGYNLYVSSASGGPYTILASPGSSPYLHDNLEPGQTRYYRISALRANGRESPQSASRSGTTQALPVPAGLAAEALSATEISLTWNSVTEADSYKVYGSSALNGPYTLIDTVSGATTYTHSGLSQNTTYYYKVTAVVTVSETPLEGAQSAAVSAKTPRVPVTPPGATLVQQLAYIAGRADDGDIYDIVVSNNIYMNPATVSTMGRDVTVIIHSASSADIKSIQLDSAGFLFSVDANVTLKLQDITLKGMSSNTSALVQVGQGGTLVLETGSKISGNTNIYSTPGGGIHINGGNLILNDGEISGNKVIGGSYGSAYGGGVYVTGGGHAVINGGLISDNETSCYSGWNFYGGGIHIDGNSTVNMTGGVISRNVADKGGGICVGNGSTFIKRHAPGSLTSGIIYGGTGGDANQSSQFAYGHAVYRYYNGTLYKRNATLGYYDEISTLTDEGWE
ncbi:MAG: hypothetical protein LBQ55_10375 [Treponema sp.]|jgi:fibronectin type 3 domain-containing protein|nr:hypothetical protein [Treponema sp.]